MDRDRESVHLLGGNDRSSQATDTPLPPSYSSLPTSVEIEHKSNASDASQGRHYKRYQYLIMMLAVSFAIYGLMTHKLNQHSRENGIYADDDYSASGSPQSPDEQNQHIHLTSREVGLSGLEGVDAKDIHVDEVSDGKERKYKCYMHDLEDMPIATGSLENNADGQGWDYLSVRGEIHPPGTDTSDDEDEVLSQYLQSRVGMGYLEGFTTCSSIQDWYSNSYQAQFDGGDPNEGILRFLEANHDWMVIQSDLHWRTSEYWMSIKGRLAQMHGLLAGIRAGCPGSDDEFGSNAPLLPTHGKRMVQDMDGFRDWIGQESPKDNDLVYHYNNPSKHHSKFGTIYLADMDQQPSLIHLLIHNANGDLYQIGDKFNIFADKPNKKSGKRKDYKRKENKKYMLKNYTHFAEDDDGEDDDGNRGRWGRETLEVLSNNKGDFSSNNGVSNKIKSSHGHHAEAMSKKRELLRTNEFNQDKSKDDMIADIEKSSYSHDHCSALVKLLANNSDVVFGHNTWDDYQNAFPRIFKSYEYPLMKKGGIFGFHKVDFSSSPGLLASIDDFYIVKGSNGANMGVMETSIDVYNRTYLDLIKPESVLAWARAVTANEMATNGAEWANRFSEFASGTYIDQWMILDFTKFKPGAKPKEGFFTVLEEMPGRIHWEDMTNHLIERSYWASYNNPYFTDIRDMTGQTALCVKNSLECYETDPRAKIFHKLQGNIECIADFRVVMQYNHWQTDTLSMNDSCRAIACRADLEEDLALWGPHGAVDAKVSSFSLSSSLLDEEIPPRVWAKLGPTHDTQPPFCWKQFENVTDLAGEDIHHRGHPACFEFDWLTMPRI